METVRKYSAEAGIKMPEVAIYDGTYFLDLAITAEPAKFNVERYNKFYLHPVSRATIFAHESLTPTQIMEALMDGYREEKR